MFLLSFYALCVELIFFIYLFLFDYICSLFELQYNTVLVSKLGALVL